MTPPDNRTLDFGDAGQLRALADRLARAWRTAERITDANPGVARQLRDFTVQAGLTEVLAREIADYAVAVAEDRVRHVTGVARHSYGDKVQLHVPGEPEPLVTSMQAIIQDTGTGLSADQVDGRSFRFTVITTTEEGDPADTPTGFRVLGPEEAS